MTCYWSGNATSGHEWRDPANWDACGGSYPKTFDTAIFNIDANITASIETVQTLVIDSTANVVYNSGYSITTSHFYLSGTFTNLKQFQIQNPTTIPLKVSGTGTFINYGVVMMDDIQSPQYPYKFWGSLENRVGGSVTTKQSFDNQNWGHLINDGTLAIDSVVTSAYRLNFDSFVNRGTFRIKSVNAVQLYVATSFQTTGTFDLVQAPGSSVIGTEGGSGVLGGTVHVETYIMYGTTLIMPDTVLKIAEYTGISSNSRVGKHSLIFSPGTVRMQEFATQRAIQIGYDMKFDTTANCTLASNIYAIPGITLNSVLVYVNNDTTSPSICNGKTLQLIESSKSIATIGNTISLSRESSAYWFISQGDKIVTITAGKSQLSNLTWIAGFLIGMMLLNCVFAFIVCTVLVCGGEFVTRRFG